LTNNLFNHNYIISLFQLKGRRKFKLVVFFALFLTNQTDRDIDFIVLGGLSFSFFV